MIENVFEHNLNDLEIEVLNLFSVEETSYLRYTEPLKILIDLHLLFLMRCDKKNCDRIMNMIRNYEDKDVSTEIERVNS